MSDVIVLTLPEGHEMVGALNYARSQQSGHHLPFTIYLFIYFKDLFTERACPQLAKANLGGPCLNKQITKEKKYIYIYTNKN